MSRVLQSEQEFTKKQGKEQCCRKGIACAETYQFTVPHLSLGIQIPQAVAQDSRPY